MPSDTPVDSSDSSCGSDSPRQVGSRKTVRVSMVVDFVVDVDVPPSADLGEQADHELFAAGRHGEYDDKDVVNVTVEAEEPLWEDDFPSPEEWPSHV